MMFYLYIGLFYFAFRILQDPSGMKTIINTYGGFSFIIVLIYSIIAWPIFLAQFIINKFD